MFMFLLVPPLAFLSAVSFLGNGCPFLRRERMGGGSNPITDLNEGVIEKKTILLPSLFPEDINL